MSGIGFGEKSYRKVSKVGKVKNENSSKKSRKVNLFRGRSELVTNAFANNWSGSQIRNDGERPRDYRKYYKCKQNEEKTPRTKPLFYACNGYMRGEKIKFKC